VSGPPTRRDNGSVAQTAKPMRKREQRIRLVVVVTVGSGPPWRPKAKPWFARNYLRNA